MTSTNLPQKGSSLVAQRLLAILGAITGIGGFVVKLVNHEFPYWLVAASGVVLLVSAAYLMRHSLQPYFAATHRQLQIANAWLVALTFLQTAVILFLLFPFKGALRLEIDQGKDALFIHPNALPSYLEAKGITNQFSWTITDDGKTGSFIYATNNAIEPHVDGCCGGYVTFYTTACDRLKYRYLRFRCKVDQVVGTPDIGVRLAVDDPSKVQDREVATYEVPSLAKHGGLSSSWQEFVLPLSDFQQKVNRPPFPPHLDANTINKLVFFIDNAIAKKCQQTTYSISEITFLP